MRHLEETGLTYWQHFRRATWFAIRLSGVVFALLVHAIAPFLFERTASGMIAGLLKEMEIKQEE